MASENCFNADLKNVNLSFTHSLVLWNVSLTVMTVSTLVCTMFLVLAVKQIKRAVLRVKFQD